jgi:pimeloyl-ACP methyl ester carboxylesterase
MMRRFAKPKQLLLGLMLCIVSAFAAGSTLSSSTSHYERPTGGKGLFKNRVIVFVHGLFGTASDTWTSSEGAYWPQLLLDDTAFNDSDIYVASYESPYFGNTMTVDELVVSLNDRFTADGVFENHREVVFVCHSLGGIVVEQFLVTYQKQYADKVPFVFLFAVPNEGSQVAALGQFLSKDPLLKTLMHGNEDDYLLALETQWRAAQFKTRRYCAYEKKSLKGTVFIVDRSSGTRNCDAPAKPINEDHWGIVKPNDRKHSSYIALRNAVVANPIKPMPGTTPGGKLPKSISLPKTLAVGAKTQPSPPAPKSSQPPPTVLQECAAGGNCAISNGQTGGTTVGQLNTGGLPAPPHVTWTAEQLAPGKSLASIVPQTSFATGSEEERRKEAARIGTFADNPGVVVTASPDDVWPTPAFAAICDRPCEGIDAIAMTGGSSVQVHHNEKTVTVQFLQPSILAANSQMKWEIRSADKEPIKILDIAAVRLRAANPKPDAARRILEDGNIYENQPNKLEVKDPGTTFTNNTVRNMDASISNGARADNNLLEGKPGTAVGPTVNEGKGADLAAIKAAQTRNQYPEGFPDAPNAQSTSERRDAVGPALADQTAKADGPNGGDVARDRPLTRNEILAQIKVALQKDRESDEMRGCQAGKSVELRTVGNDISYYVCVQQCFARWNTASLKDLDFGGFKISQPYDDPRLALVEIPCLQKGSGASAAFCTKISEGTSLLRNASRKR